jgi:hypothetical protein
MFARTSYTSRQRKLGCLRSSGRGRVLESLTSASDQGSPEFASFLSVLSRCISAPYRCIAASIHSLANISNCGAVLVTSPDWRAGCSRAQTPGNQDRASRACRPPYKVSACSEPNQRKPRRGWGRAGLQRAVHLGGLSPGLRTERRNPYDTPQGKMVRARLPGIVNAKIRFGCCASTTVGEVAVRTASATA